MFCTWNYIFYIIKLYSPSVWGIKNIVYNIDQCPTKCNVSTSLWNNKNTSFFIEKYIFWIPMVFAQILSYKKLFFKNFFQIFVLKRMFTTMASFKILLSACYPIQLHFDNLFNTPFDIKMAQMTIFRYQCEY